MRKEKIMARISAKGAFNIFWGVAASSIISAIGVILVAGFLSESEYGLVAIALFGPNLIAIFRDWGVDTATIRYTAQYRSLKKEVELKNVLAAVAFFEFVLGFSLFIISFFHTHRFLPIRLFKLIVRKNFVLFRFCFVSLIQ